MAVTALVPTHRVSINYTADGLNHKHQFLASAVPGRGTSLFNFVTQDSSTQDVDDIVQAYSVLFQAALYTGGQLQDYSLEVFGGGAYIPVFSKGIGLTGTESGAHILTSRLTMQFRDKLSKLVKLVMFGSVAGVPQRLAMSSVTTGPYAAFFGTFAAPAGAHMGNVVMGRSGAYLGASLDYTVSLDRKSRRRLGYV